MRPNGRCKAQSCRIALFWAVNPDTGKKVPLALIGDGEGLPQNAVRYDLDTTGAEYKAVRNAEGRFVNHSQTCPEAHTFNRSKKK